MKVHVSENILINAKPEVVREQIVDFHHWPAWSPWLITEPDTSVSYEGEPGTVGHGYSWVGERTGEGSMQITQIDDQSMTIDLSFLKPFKSQAVVQLRWEPKDAEVEVTWVMDTKLPFFMFFFANTMRQMIALDYRRGLLLLKDICEHGEPLSKIQVLGVVQIEAQQLVGPAAECGLDQMGEVMGPLASEVEAANPEAKSPMSAAYTKLKPFKNEIGFVIGQVDGQQDDGFESLALEGGAYLCIEHIGPYYNLGNAWAYGESLLRSKSYRRRKGIPFETYHDRELSESQWRVRLHLPVCSR